MTARARDLTRPNPSATPESPLALDDVTSRLAILIRSLRPKQWAKNLLVAAAPGAAGILGRGPVLGRTALAFVSFCLVSSAMYLVNDVLDADSDSRDPRRRRRPIAAGRVSKPLALFAAGGAMAGAVATGAVLGPDFVGAVLLYAALTLAYSLHLKQVAVVDIAIVASGFVIRAVAGSLATDVELSRWFLILVSFAALFVVSGKRLSELVALDQRGPVTVERRSVRRRPLEYTIPFLRSVAMVAAAVAIAGYCLWALAPVAGAHGLAFRELSTVPFVLAILRYALLVETGNGDSPEDLFLQDRPLQLMGVAWVIVYGLGVYVGH